MHFPNGSFPDSHMEPPLVTQPLSFLPAEGGSSSQGCLGTGHGVTPLLAGLADGGDLTPLLWEHPSSWDESLPLPSSCFRLLLCSTSPSLSSPSTAAPPGSLQLGMLLAGCFPSPPRCTPYYNAAVPEEKQQQKKSEPVSNYALFAFI